MCYDWFVHVLFCFLRDAESSAALRGAAELILRHLLVHEQISLYVEAVPYVLKDVLACTLHRFHYMFKHFLHICRDAGGSGTPPRKAPPPKRGSAAFHRCLFDAHLDRTAGQKGSHPLISAPA